MCHAPHIECADVRCSVVQSGAVGCIVCYSVLKCGAVCCSVLQCGAWCHELYKLEADIGCSMCDKAAALCYSVSVL